MTRGGFSTVQERHEESAVMGEPCVEIFPIDALSPTRTRRHRRTVRHLLSKHGRKREHLRQRACATVTVSYRIMAIEDEQITTIAMTDQA